MGLCWPVPCMHPWAPCSQKGEVLHPFRCFSHTNTGWLLHDYYMPLGYPCCFDVASLDIEIDMDSHVDSKLKERHKQVWPRGFNIFETSVKFMRCSIFAHMYAFIQFYSLDFDFELFYLKSVSTFWECYDMSAAFVCMCFLDCLLFDRRISTGINLLSIDDVPLNLLSIIYIRISKDFDWYELTFKWLSFWIRSYLAHALNAMLEDFLLLTIQIKQRHGWKASSEKGNSFTRVKSKKKMLSSVTLKVETAFPNGI